MKSGVKYIAFFSAVVPVLTYLLAKKEITPHEINISAIDMFAGGVDTVGIWSITES
jgi:hypothetical protein